VSTPWADAALVDHLHEIDELLQRHAQFWRPQAFTFLQMPWETNRPLLAKNLRALSLEQAEQLAANEMALADFLRDFIPDAQAIVRAATVPPFVTPALEPIAETRNVPGRKWQQITAFEAVVPSAVYTALEWCAGKSHLGRLVARKRGCAVSALEWNAELIAEGRHLAQRDNLPVTFHQLDVLSAAAFAHIHSEQCVVALHACGDLHRQLLRGCVERQPAQLLLAPCCYHLTDEAQYPALSQAGARSAVQLSRDDLRTAVQGTVTAPARVQQQRKNLQAWRLGFDVLQRELRASADGSSDYVPAPSLPLSVLRAGFPAFCAQLAEHHVLSLPDQLDYPHYEAIGWERLREVTALDLPRLMFRRALEVWLVLDRALLLCEAGYAVAVGTFCRRELTPRNLLIRAQRLTLPE
jgi:hypothetical protein